MKTGAYLLVVVMALAIGYFIYEGQLQSVNATKVPPKQRIDVVGVKSDLLAIAQAERMFLAIHGRYATLEQLQEDGSLTFSGADRRGYRYRVELDGAAGFKVTASPVDPSKKDWPTLTIDQLMEIFGD